MFHVLLDWLKSWQGSIERLQTTRLVIVPCFVGATTGAAAIGFVELLNLVQWCVIGSSDLPLRVLPHLSWYHILLAPAAGGLIVGPLIRYLAPEAEGHGVPEVIEAVMLRGGRIRRRVAAVKTIASAVTIGSGGSVGREGPIVQIGAAIGSAVGQFLRFPPEQLKTLAACGAAAGIAAVFNAPIAGAFFALEVIVGNFAVPSFSPVILASVLGTVVSRAYFGDHPAFVVQPYRLESLYEIPVYAGLGVVCGIVAAAFIWTMSRFESWVPRLPVAKQWRPALGGLVLGLMIVLIPNLYGVGYATMDAALRGDLPWQTLVLLVPFKMVATSLTLASGGSGGVFLPSLYIGSVAGGLYGIFVHALLPHTAGAGAYALVGMAGVLSAATHSPITSMILLFEVSGDYAIILPVMIVVTLATLIGRVFEADSLYTLQLSRKGIALHRREDIIMRTHTAAEVMHPAAHVVRDNTTAGEIVQYFLEREAIEVYVVDKADHLLGCISIHDIKDPEIAKLGPLVLARDVAETNIHSVMPSDTLADCMNELMLSDNEQLSVIDSEGHLAGVISRGDVLRLYSSELLRHEFLSVTHDGDARREWLRLPPGLIISRVRAPAALVGISLREANLRAAHRLTVVAVRHSDQQSDQFPDPDRPITKGDVLVVVGAPDDVRRLKTIAEVVPDDENSGAPGPR